MSHKGHTRTHWRDQERVGAHWPPLEKALRIQFGKKVSGPFLLIWIQGLLQPQRYLAVAFIAREKRQECPERTEMLQWQRHSHHLRASGDPQHKIIRM